MHHLLLIVHLLAATIWVGGHLVLSLGILPAALRTRDIQAIRTFEARYEKTGIPALVILIITGIMMAYDYNVTVTTWFSFSNSIEKVVSVKLILLIVTAALGVHARLWIIPRLSDASLNKMAVHIILITLTGIAMLVMGSLVRIGGL